MKYTTLCCSLLLMLLLSPVAYSQVVHRAQINPYALRRDAELRTHSEVDPPIVFAPEAIESSFGEVTHRQRLEMPQSWLDASVYLHIENAKSAYTLRINGRDVVECHDSFTPTTYDISPYLRVGDNTILVVSHPSSLAMLESGVESVDRPKFAESYIFTQSRLRIIDYVTTIVEHDDKKGGQLFIDVVVENRFNFAETIEVGFDLYDPLRKLVDFSTAKKTLEGNSIDTIRFAPHIYGAAQWRWNPAAAKGMQKIGRPTTRYTDQPLYSVMLFTKRNRVSSGYIPFSVGYSLPAYSDLSLRVAPYNAVGDQAQTEKELRTLKARHFNTVAPSTPQPLWFYSLCDKVGLYVIDQAAINAPESSTDRKVGGTPSNDPALLDQYLERVKKMYYRTRNFSCVVAYSLGADAGNGYNMYKAYQWLKSVEKERPIIYGGAAGEWNSDELNIE